MTALWSGVGRIVFAADRHAAAAAGFDYASSYDLFAVLVEQWRLSPLHVPVEGAQEPYTRLAFEGYQFAKEHGLADIYNDRMLRAFFEDGFDIGDLGVLERLADELGLPAAEYRAALEEGSYAEAHRAALVEAAAHRITAVPTILVGDVRIEGMPRADALREAIDKAEANEQDRLAHGVTCSIDGC